MILPSVLEMKKERNGASNTNGNSIRGKTGDGAKLQDEKTSFNHIWTLSECRKLYTTRLGITTPSGFGALATTSKSSCFGFPVWRAKRSSSEPNPLSSSLSKASVAPAVNSATTVLKLS